MAVLEAGIVRLRDASGRVVGAGILVGSGQILTCSHVVGLALGHRDAGLRPPEAAVTVDFPLVAPDVALTARVVRWQPVQEDGRGDVAGLRLQSPAPAGVKALRLLTAPELWGHPFRTFGFPTRHDDGVWASGRLMDRQATGWVQLEDVKTTGFRVEPGFSGAPVWDDELGGVVGMAVAAEAHPEVRAAFMIPANVLITAWPDLERQTLPPSPYRGLYAFREEDHELFFGREELESQLVEQLSHQPLVGVIGPSGSGKSSLVFAGAVPRLRQRFVSPPGVPRPRQRPEWVVAAMRPAAGASPLAALAWALLPVLEPETTETQRLGEVRGLEAVLAEGRLAEVADRARQRVGAERLLLVVDQFEELFGQHQTTTREFIDLLGQALDTQPERGRPNLVMTLTLRADFLGHTLEHPVLAQALQGRVLLIGRMTRRQLRQVIESPAANQVTFEAGLVERILDDVGTGPGNLPLLEFSLTLLWELQTDRLLTHAAYESLGGVDGALARYAEQVYADELATPEQQEARRLLVQLVRPGEATEHTRRVARRSELDDGRWLAAQHLATTRLVVTGRDERGEETVEVVHEALIAGWGRLRDWVQADRAFRVWQERLRGALAEWQRTGHDEDMLLRGVALAEAERWLEQRPVDIGSLERDFIAASRAHQHRGVRRLRAVAAALAGFLILALGLGAVALIQGHRADAQSRRAISLYLLTRSESQPDLSILLTLAAHRLWPTDQTRASLLAQLDRRRDVSAMLTGHTAGLRAVVYSRDGRMLASAGADNTIRLWDPSRRTLARVLVHPNVSSIAFSPDGRTLASASDNDAGIRLWDVGSGTGLGVLADRSGRTRTLAFSPNGRTLAAGADDTVILWDVAARRPSTIGRVAGVRQVTFSPDGRTLVAAGDRDPRIRRWRLPSRAPLPALRGHSDGVQAIAFSPDGRRLASAGVPEDGTIRLWELMPRPQSHQLNQDEIAIDTSALAFSPDGRTLASAADYARLIWLWDVAGRTRVGALTGHTDTVTTLAFSPDGHTLASGSTDRTVALLDLTVPTLSGHAGRINNVAFSRDGGMLASAGDDRRVILWDTARRSRLRVLQGHSAAVTRVAFSPDSRILASTGEDGKTLLWDLDRQTPARELPRHPAGAGRLAFSPAGRLLALPGDAGRIALWDLDRGTSRTLTGHDGPVLSVAFSPDGATLASGGDDRRVILWDVARGIPVRVLPGHTDGVDSVAFRPDGATLASAGENVLLWDVARGSQVATLGVGISVAFSPDGRMLAVGTAAQPPDFNSSVVLWDATKRVPYATLERGIGATFSPDGRTLATAGQDIVLRNMDAASWPRRLCQMVGRELTRAEWANHIPGRSYQTVCR
jgi:WD40 repeat protein